MKEKAFCEVFDLIPSTYATVTYMFVYFYDFLPFTTKWTKKILKIVWVQKSTVIFIGLQNINRTKIQAQKDRYCIALFTK